MKVYVLSWSVRSFHHISGIYASREIAESRIAHLKSETLRIWGEWTKWDRKHHNTSSVDEFWDKRQTFIDELGEPEADPTDSVFVNCVGYAITEYDVHP